MVMPVSSEFIELCEAQAEILSDALGAALCIVYLADEPNSDSSADRHSTHLIPIVARPQGAAEWTNVEQTAWLENQLHWESSQPRALPSPLSAARSDDAGAELETTAEPLDWSQANGSAYRSAQPQSRPQTSSTGKSTEIQDSIVSDSSPPNPALQNSEPQNSEPNELEQPSRLEETQAPEKHSATAAIAPMTRYQQSSDPLQIAVPLVYQGVMVGLLITARSDRFWSPREQRQIEQIAKTLTSAYVVDQRARWLKQRLTTQQTHQKELYAQQQDVFDDLLHQFRNPLTALRTFGKLLLRRLQPDDQNQDVAEGIVRESDRLQALLQQFKSALDDPLPLLMPASGSSESDSASASELVNQPLERQNPAAIADGTPALTVVPPTSSALTLPSDSKVRLSEAKQVESAKRLSSSQYLTGHEICREPCHWHEILAPILVVSEAIAQERAIDLQVDIPAGLPAVLADSLGLRESMSNLIDNALKYTPAGGYVRVHAGIRSLGLQAIAIIDSGPGIPATDLEHLFERHYRGVQAQGSIAGTGLGLAIARDLLHQMDGDIEVFSPVSEAEFLPQWNPNEVTDPGTAFVVWLEEVEASSSESFL